MCTLATIHLARGGRDEAYSFAEEALRLAETQGLRYGGPLPEIALARIKMADASPAVQAEAAGWLDREEQVANETGRLVRLPAMWELRADLALKSSDASAHDKALREALPLYRESGATKHAERLAKELVPVN